MYKIAFAIAFITSLVHGEEPCDVLYQQENLRRQHLIVLKVNYDAFP